MVSFTQEGKSISISPLLGKDTLLLQSISGSEHISKPFNFQLEILSENTNIEAAEIVGKNIDIKIRLGDMSERVLNGFVRQFVAGPIQSSGHRLYIAEMVPWFQLMTLNQDCRIFQNVDVKAIIEEVFQSKGYSDFEINAQRSFRTREYCVQYRETDFEFVSRLMEEEGIYYFFAHEEGAHKMILGDSTGSYVECSENQAEYYTAGRLGDNLNQWEHQYSLITGKWAQTDYNFKTSSTDISTNVDSIVDLPGIDAYEQYDYPGLYENRGDGDGLTKTRIESEEAAYNVVNSAGSYRSFTAGGKFTLSRHEIKGEQDKSFVITSISHHARENSYDVSQGGSHDYSNNFQCIPDDVVYRPQRVTRIPFVRGPQTAVVVGPSGEEIYVDEFGRIKVQFHWDRVGENDENSSCWLRVSQQWAGKKWGAVFLPRIGHEVIVSFLEGNPDLPLVTGCVYNAENMPPYDLPANKTQSGWKTRSTKEGGTANFNELRFEDLKGSEEIYIHAEKDQNNHVENDETTFVGHDRTEDVGNDETITIGNDRTETVGNDETITITANRTESVGKNESISIGENRSENVGKNEEINIGKNRTEQVGDNETITIGKNQEMTIGKDQEESVGDNRKVQIGKNDTLNVGKKLSVVVGDEISFKCGKSVVVMKKDGKIQITGKELNIKMSGNIKMKGSKIAQN